jgi:hypothetical protein
MSDETCIRCGLAVPADDSFHVIRRETDEVGDGIHSVTACRIEHLASWTVRGGVWPPDWQNEADDETVAGSSMEEIEKAAGSGQCAQCEGDLPDDPYFVKRIKLESESLFAFCSLDDLRKWSLAGGPWAAR